MNDPKKEIENLLQQIAAIKTRQVVLKQDINNLEYQLEMLRNRTIEGVAETSVSALEIESLVPEAPSGLPGDDHKESQAAPLRQQPMIPRRKMEDFIGTDIISKAGILITVIGIFIGAKYAIDKDLISPAIRIVLGYVAGLILMFIAFRLKKTYTYFSAVLMGGGLSVVYFITYISYSFYQFFPQLLAFSIMVFTTMVAVAIALWYNKRIIALLGQVAAYAIPFLLSNNSGNVFALFSYISIINLGLVYLSYKKDWKLIFYTAFFISWFIYFFWLVEEADTSARFSIGISFVSINFLTFYVAFLSYKVIREQLFALKEVAALVMNALLFFFMGYYMVDHSFPGIIWPTGFSLANAGIHGAVALLMYQWKVRDKALFGLLAGLTVLYLTIAVPVALDGNWVSLLWTLQSVILISVGISQGRGLFVKLSWPLFTIALLSIVQDWSEMYPYLNGGVNMSQITTKAFAGVNFWMTLVSCTGFGYAAFLANEARGDQQTIISFRLKAFLALAFIGTLYLTLFHEIHFAFDTWAWTDVGRSGLVNSKRDVGLFTFTFIYFTLWLVINQHSIQQHALQKLLLGGAILSNFIFLLAGLEALGVIRQHVVMKMVPLTDLLAYRYTVIIALAALWFTAHRSVQHLGKRINLQPWYSGVFNITLLTLIINEYLQWMHVLGISNQYKLGISLIAGAYALVLIFLGLLRMKKHWRVFAIVLFGVTIAKLFFYDLSSLSTISKTIVMVGLGSLLLLSSFFYNKYKHLIKNDTV